MSKLGTEAKPAIIRLAPHSKQDEILALIDKHKIQFIAGFEDDEDISDLRGLIPDADFDAVADPNSAGNNKARRAGMGRLIFSKAASRNAPCPCGSGKLYKRCCGK